MTKHKHRSPRFEVEWVTISYRTLARWGVALLVLAVIGGGIWLALRLEASGERKEVEILVSAVERDVRAARASRAPADAPDEIREAETRVELARERLGANDWTGARAEAEGARELLKRLGNSRSDRARILRVEGQVQVKPVGSLDWVTGKVGMGLNVGDLVRTGASSGAEIVNLDGTVATLAPDSTMKVARSAKDSASGKTDVAVVVNSGQLTMATSELVKPPGSTTEVQTANLRASIDRNTVVGVDVDEKGNSSALSVLTGQARVESGQTVVDLGTAERLTASAAGIERRKLPGIPVLVSPPQYKLLLVRDLDRHPLDLEWNSARDARSYRVELSQSPLFSRVVGRWDTQAVVHSAGKLPVGRYYWRVTALDGDGFSGGPSPAAIFQISDALPGGSPPPLKITDHQALGDGVFLFEGKTQPGVFLTIDDGEQVLTVAPGVSGEFHQVVKIAREGMVTVTFTARNSEGLETRVPRGVEVRYQ